MRYEEVHADNFEICPICNRKIKSNEMEWHHIIPQAKGGKFGPVFRICGSCHDMIHYHVRIDEVEKYDTVEKVLLMKPLQPYLTWIKTKNNSKIYRLGDIFKRLKSFQPPK